MRSFDRKARHNHGLWGPLLGSEPPAVPRQETKTWLRSRSFDGVTPRGPGLAQAEGPAPEGATEPPSPPRRGRSATRWAEGAEVQDELEEKNELLLSLNYTWSVWWQGLRFMKDDSLSGGGVQQLHAKRKHLGQSWQDVLRLLGSLPSLAEFLGISCSQIFCKVFVPTCCESICMRRVSCLSIGMWGCARGCHGL